MAVDFSKWDKAITDKEGFKKDIEEASKGGEYSQVPYGKYEVKIVKLELVENSKGKPMLTCWFEIVVGDYKKQKIFMNQNVDLPFQIHIANEFLRSLDSGVEVVFDSYAQYNQMILDIHEAIDGKLEYLLEFSEGKKGFDKFEIKEIYEVA